MRRILLLCIILLAGLSPAVLAKPVEIALVEMHRTTGGGGSPSGTIDFQTEKIFDKVVFAPYINHHHSPGNSLTFTLSLNGTAIYTTSWSLSAVYQAPVEYVRSLGNTRAQNFSYSGYLGSQSQGFAYMDVRMPPYLLRGRILRDDDITDFGVIDDYINQSPTSNRFAVESTTPGIAVWVDEDGTNLAQKATSDPRHHIWACADTNVNNLCDIDEGSYRTCNENGGDWYKGQCCGKDVTTCGLVGSIYALNTIYVKYGTSYGQTQNIVSFRTTATVGYTPLKTNTLYVKKSLYSSIPTQVRAVATTGFTAVSAPVVYVVYGTGTETTTIKDVVTTQPPSTATYTALTLYTGTSSGALCGKNAAGDWEWVPLDDTGEIHQMGCPNASVVTDGALIYHCGAGLENVTQAAGDFRTIQFEEHVHEYSCVDKQFHECGGSFGPFSSSNGYELGTTNPALLEIQYCASDGDWTPDLDTKDEASCTAAGLGWTGSKCCSEADDPNEYYNDHDPNATGGCWNQVKYPSGDFTVPERVINYRGQFWGCKITDNSLLALRDTHTNDPLVNNSLQSCGMVLENAQPGGQPHARCSHDGTWDFTNEPGGTINKSIAWPTLVNLSAGLSRWGCCAYDQCWNGTSCQNAGAFYRIGEAGYTCQLPEGELQQDSTPPLISLPRGGIVCSTLPDGRVACIA
jgi:hypothetical protein